MINATEFRPNWQLTGLTASLLLALGACGQPPTDAVEAASGDSAAVQQEQATGSAMDGIMASIDAQGNIAPFGFAAKKPVEIEPADVVVQGDIATATSVLYGVHCVACHGADATGVAGLGLNLVESELVAVSSDAELAAFLKAGRAADSPDNTTGIPMPSFSWMSDADLAELGGYLKSL